MDNEELEILEPATPRGKLRSKILSAIISFLIVVVLAVIAATLVKRYYTVTFYVNGSSMVPTLDGGDPQIKDDGDKLILWKNPNIKRGDIVVFRRAEDDYALVKRVIAIGGDTVKLEPTETGVNIYINGKLLDEPYINEPMDKDRIDNNQTVTVSEGAIFCMGDNRNNSSDSRAFGEVQVSDVIGKVLLIIDAETNDISFPKK
ncbi:MAG: signal peptidase I [Christensenellales bacterium]|jgi:signal peptidase I|nr:signal peptidase I [Clostridia bacterium]HRU84786.1 signal peptidase I [Eubacteriales bacterium]